MARERGMTCRPQNIHPCDLQNSHPSRCQPLQAVLVMETAQNRSRHNAVMGRKVVTNNRGRRQVGRRIRDARPQAGMRAASIVMARPLL